MRILRLAHQDDLKVLGHKGLYLLYQGAQAPDCQPLILPCHYCCAHLRHVQQLVSLQKPTEMLAR